MENNRYNFTQIRQDYKIMLLDANAILDAFGSSLPSTTWVTPLRDRKTGLVHNQTDYILFLQQCVKEGYPLYVTEEILGEINQKADPQDYSRHVKHLRDKRRKVVPARAIERKEIEIDRLVSLLLNKNRVIKVEEHEEQAYFKFYTRFHDLAASRKLSHQDIDFLISGMTWAEKRGETALLTNDKGIQEVWTSLAEEEVFNSVQLGLYIGRGLERFVRAEDYEAEKATRRSVRTLKEL